jgi:hypothetical protein
MIAVGAGPKRLRDEPMARNLRHDLEDPGVVDAPRADELDDHLAAHGFLPAFDRVASGARRHRRP